MATAEDYAQWIVKNESKKGTDEFNTVVQAYKIAKEQAFEQAQEFNVLETKPRSTLGVLGQSAIKGVAGLGDVVAGFPSNVKNLYNYARTNEPLGKFSQPITESLIHSNVLKPENEPNTPVLKAMDFTTQLATGGGINPMSVKNLLPSLARLGTQGVVGSGIQQGLQGIDVNNPLAQAGATALGMGLVGAPTALRTTVGDVARNSLKNVTPEQLKLADLLMKDAQKLGTPLTAAEALSQVTGGNRLTSTQRIVENAPKSAQTMADFMAQRPNANEMAFRNTIEQVSPFVTRPLTLNQASSNFLERSEKGLTKGVEPYYQNAMGEMKNLSAGKSLPVLPVEVKQLATNPSIEDAINHVIKDKYSGVTGLSPNDPKTLLSAKKFLDAQYTKFSNKMTESFDKEKAANAFGASRQIDDFLAQKSPSYAKGRDIYANAQTNVIQPRKEGMLGQLAETGGTTESMMQQQSNILMPPSPKATTPQDISATIKLLRREDPNVVKDWTRQNLQGIFDENAQKLQSGANQFGAAKFASAITGNEQQRNNLKTLISQGSSPQAWKGFETMLDVFEAQGKRLPAGSATAFNQAALEELKGGGLVKGALTPIKPSKIMDVYEQFRLGENTQKLAQLLTDPNGIKKLEELSKTKPNSAKAQVLVNSIAGGMISAKPTIEENQ